ncbi:MAG: hypothetical protein ABIB71_04680 [Candidatus Woesearchaeota archaeon]
MKEIEKEGFKLDFPSYDSNEDKILEILNENNLRLNLALPLLLRHKFDYEKIILRLSKDRPTHTRSIMAKNFNKIILISNKIFLEEKIENEHLQKIIDKHKLKEKISENEYRYFYDSFKEFTRKSDEDSEEKLRKQLKLRGTLNTNLALSAIFSPGKIRIMNKIFNHISLSNTELKYYYRSIRPLSRAILNDNLQRYIRLIESNKKYTLKNDH